eukprot:TRINITY_DN3864_c0_g1_i1.p1 TRINITY_DN3864_c0_g1~~TRINITY_DN3864_c0_g1_i1.p1  ORF type:complete len:188 (+),score=14.58 TRINITY_DN3864_c0_g1_i1:122-685(+)
MALWSRSTGGPPTACFSVVICRHPDGRFLCVEESRNRGWWIPAGFVDPGDDFFTCATREAREEAGIDVRLVGILRIEHSINTRGARMRVIFYAVPVNPDAPLKTVPDEESVGSAWLTLEEIEAKASRPPPKGLRGHEGLEWGRYVAAGGPVYPLDLLAIEGLPITVPEPPIVPVALPTPPSIPPGPG